MSIFKKTKIGNKRELYLFGIKIAEYTKKRQVHLTLFNKEKVEREMASFPDNGYGLSKERRNPRLIVSLTSYPDRMADLHLCLYSLLNQQTKPDMLILWLAESQFPGKEDDLPKAVLKWQSKGLTIKWCDDIKSFKKLIPALKEYPEDIIVTADDDLFYSPQWLSLLYQSYCLDPAIVHCHRAHKITFDENNHIKKYSEWFITRDHSSFDMSYLNFCTTGSGNLYPPHCLHPDVLKKEIFLKLCPFYDDLWFWAMAILNNTNIAIVKNNISELDYLDVEREEKNEYGTTLYSINRFMHEKQFNHILEYYPAIKTKLIETISEKKQHLNTANLISHNKNALLDHLNHLDIKETRKLMIVAHPDDETLWGGCHLLHDQNQYLVVCLTAGSNENRYREFANAMTICQARHLSGAFPDLNSDGQRDNWQHTEKDIKIFLETILHYKKWDLIVTHNPDGEYGHQHHQMTSQFVTAIYKKYINNETLFYFGIYYRSKYRKIIKHDKNRPVTTLKIKRDGMINQYESQYDFIRNHRHMLDTENWIKYENWAQHKKWNVITRFSGMKLPFLKFY